MNRISTLKTIMTWYKLKKPIKMLKKNATIKFYKKNTELRLIKQQYQVQDI